VAVRVRAPLLELRPGRLLTSRLVLVPARRSDAADLERLFHDPRVNRYLPPARRRESGLESVRRAQRNARIGSAVRFTVRSRSDDQFVGQVTLFGRNPDDRKAEIGYAFAVAAWGHGYATEATARVIDWAFGPLRLHRIEASVVAGNRASVRVLRRLGFRREGVRRDGAIDGRAFVDLVEFGRLAADAPGRRRRPRA
jgi:[ribosomal protein S5]-alanine N-acetyltransferase